MPLLEVLWKIYKKQQHTVQVYSAHFVYIPQLQMTFVYYIQSCFTSSKKLKQVINQLQNLISPVSMSREAQLKGRVSFIRNGAFKCSKSRKINNEIASQSP